MPLSARLKVGLHKAGAGISVSGDRSAIWSPTTFNTLDRKKAKALLDSLNA
jgi:hypothetical protein